MKLENIISNPVITAAGYLGAFGGLFADYLGVGYAYLYSLVGSAGLAGLGLYQEYKKEKLYKKPFLPIPIVVNISNPADSKNALNQLVKNIEEEGFKNHLENLQKYFSIEPDDLIFEYKGDIFNKLVLTDFLKILKHDIEKLERKIPRGICFT